MQQILILSFALLLFFAESGVAQESHADLKRVFSREQDELRKALDRAWRPYRITVKVAETEVQTAEPTELRVGEEAPERFEVAKEWIDLYTRWASSFESFLPRSPNESEALQVQMDLLSIYDRLIYFETFNEADLHKSIGRARSVGHRLLLGSLRKHTKKKIKQHMQSWLRVYLTIDPRLLRRTEVDLLAYPALSRAEELDRADKDQYRFSKRIDNADKVREFWQLTLYPPIAPSPREETCGMQYANVRLAEERAEDRYLEQQQAHTDAFDERFADKVPTPDELVAFEKEMRKKGTQNPTDYPVDDWLLPYANLRQMCGKHPVRYQIMDAELKAYGNLHIFAKNFPSTVDHDVDYYRRSFVELYLQLAAENPAHPVVGDRAAQALDYALELDASIDGHAYKAVEAAVGRSFEENFATAFGPGPLYLMVDHAQRVALRTGSESDRLAAIALAGRLVAEFPASRVAEAAEEVARGLEKVKLGDAAPNFVASAFTKKEGEIVVEQVSLEELRGKVVLLEFWYIECAGCMKLIPRLLDIQRDFGGREDFVLLSVFTGHQDEQGIREHLEEMGLRYGGAKDSISWQQIRDMDSEQKLRDLYSVTIWPTTIIIDGSGQIVARGLKGWELYHKIKALLPH